MVPGDSAGHSNLHGTHGNMTFGRLPGPSWRPRPQASSQPSVTTGATNTSSCLLSCLRASGQDWPLAIAQTWTSPWTQEASRPFTLASFSTPSPPEPRLSTQPMNCSTTLSLFPLPTLYSLSITVPDFPAPSALGGTWLCGAPGSFMA